MSWNELVREVPSHTGTVHTRYLLVNVYNTFDSVLEQLWFLGIGKELRKG